MIHCIVYGKGYNSGPCMAEVKEVTRQIEKVGGSKLCSLKDSNPASMMMIMV